jgi:hypothetical protein
MRLLLLAILLAPKLAFAQFNFLNKENNVVVSGMTGCTATAINSASSCELKDTTATYRQVFPRGYGLMTLWIYYDWAAGTGYSFRVEACREGMASTDCTDNTDWFVVHGESYASGTMTLADGTFTEGSISADHYAVWSMFINYPRVRLANIVASGSPTASDKITIVAEFANTLVK